VFDLLFSAAALVFISHILLIISLGVKMSSPGPIIFKQRRYGLDGKQILIYKFRTMTVAEDGAVVLQATKQDQRITPFGRILRKTQGDSFPSASKCTTSAVVTINFLPARITKPRARSSPS